MATADRPEENELQKAFDDLPEEMRNMKLPMEKELSIITVARAVEDADLRDPKQAAKLKEIFLVLYKTSIYRDEFWKNELKKKFNT